MMILLLFGLRQSYSPTGQSHARRGGRSSGFDECGKKATAYRAPGAAFEGWAATSISPETEVMELCAVIVLPSGGRLRSVGQGAEVRLLGRGVAQGLMNAPTVVEGEVPGQGLTCFAAGGICVQVDVFIFHAPPEPFDEDVVDPAALARHCDRHPGGLQRRGPNPRW